MDKTNSTWTQADQVVRLRTTLAHNNNQRRITKIQILRRIIQILCLKGLRVFKLKSQKKCFSNIEILIVMIILLYQIEVTTNK